jgi:hypothetical protein
MLKFDQLKTQHSTLTRIVFSVLGRSETLPLGLKDLFIMIEMKRL